MIWFTIAHAAQTSGAVATPATASGIGALGLDVKAVVFQVVNFGFLLVILRAFAYKPVLEIFRQRRLTIETSLAKAEQIEAIRRDLELEKQRTLDQARSQAKTIVADSRQQAKAILAASQVESRQRVQLLMSEAALRQHEELARLRREFKSEAMGLVVLATERVMNAKLDGKNDQTLVRRAITFRQPLDSPAEARR